ncbi:hypothetical protein Lal_00049578 [Lupinus albus]|nr:hypothetical protein Lal_00049578 [Lupinus albus]
MASKCSLRNVNAESSNNLFFACPFSLTISQWWSCIFGIPLNLTSIENLLKACQLHWSPHLKEVIVASNSSKACAHNFKTENANKRGGGKLTNKNQEIKEKREHRCFYTGSPSCPPKATFSTLAAQEIY